MPAAGGTATINAITQNGYAAGQLQSVAINNNGIVVGTFSNGQNLDLASGHAVALQRHQLSQGARRRRLCRHRAVGAGDSRRLRHHQRLVARRVEHRHRFDEFTKLIVTQQAYSANTKVITTANSMVQDLLNVLR